MPYKLIALDLDDTLLNSECNISPRNKAAIEKAREMGLTVTFNTGRMYSSAKPYAEDLELTAPLITYQGALIKSVAGKEIYHQKVPLDLAKEVIRTGERTGLQAFIYLDDQLFVANMTQEVKDYWGLIRIPAQEVGDLTVFLKEAPTKVLLFGKNADEREALWSELTRQFGRDLYMTQSTPCYFEFTHPEATKGRGLSILCEYLGIDTCETLVFGDSFNDLDAFRNAGFAVAMGNAWDEVKEAADFVTDTNDQDGVAKGIERFVLEEKTSEQVSA